MTIKEFLHREKYTLLNTLINCLNYLLMFSVKLGIGCFLIFKFIPMLIDVIIQLGGPLGGL